jgi:anti-sigma B factor antagonist
VRRAVWATALDLGDVQYLLSAALGKLIKLNKKVVGRGGKLRIENLRSDILDVFRITRLDKVFDIER